MKRLGRGSGICLWVRRRSCRYGVEIEGEILFFVLIIVMAFELKCGKTPIACWLRRTHANPASFQLGARYIPAGRTASELVNAMPDDELIRSQGDGARGTLLSSRLIFPQGFSILFSVSNP